MRTIGARPTWLVPLIIVLVFQFAFMVLVGQHIGWRTIAAQQMEKSPQIQSLPTEKKEEAIDQGTKFGAIVAYSIVAIGVPVGMALMAGVLLGSTNMFGGRLTSSSHSLSSRTLR